MPAVKVTVAFCLATMLLCYPVRGQGVQAQGTTVTIDPRTLRMTIGQSFEVTVEIHDVTDLSEWQLEIHFNPSLLTCTNITIPVNNIFGSDILLLPQDINNTTGQLMARCAVDGQYGVSGTGSLCKISFQTTSPGISFIDISDETNYIYGSYLADPSTPEPNTIPFEGSDGMVEVGDEGFEEHVYHETLNSTDYVVLLHTNSTVTGFDYSYSEKRIEFIAGGLEGGTAWTSLVLPKALLSVPQAVLINGSAVYPFASQNETHVAMSFGHGLGASTIQVLSTLLFDINGDRIINMVDLWIVARAFDSRPNDPNWNPLADILRDSVINYSDLATVAQHFGEIMVP